MAFNKEECTGIYLIFFKSTQNNIRSKIDLIDILRESGRYVDKTVLSYYWKTDTKEILFHDYLKICREVPVITKTELVRELKKMDNSNEGFLDKAEFIKSMTESGMKLSRREITEIVNKVDTNATGRLNFEDLATLLLSNLEAFKALARNKVMENEGKITKTSSKGEESSNPNVPVRSSISGKGKVDEGPVEKYDTADVLLIEKSLSSRYEYREPKNLKAWQKVTMRGCIFLGDVTNAITVQNSNIEYHTYKFTLNSTSNVVIIMSPLTLLKNIDLKKIPDIGFAIVNKAGDIFSLSLPVDASGAVYHHGSVPAGSYVLVPFTTGAKLKTRLGSASDNFQDVIAVKKGTKGELIFTDEMKSMLEDVFKICDTDGNGYLNKDEYRLFFERTNEEDWEESLWNDVKNLVQLHNDEMPFSEFSKLIMKEIVEDNGDTSSLSVTLDYFGYSDKRLLEEAFPFSMTFQVENSVFLAKCNGISNHPDFESLICKFVINQGEKFEPKTAWRDCSFYTWLKGGRFLIAMENTNSITKQSPLRLNINMNKSINVTVYKDKLERDIAIPSGQSVLAVHGVPIEAKVSVSFHCLLRRI